MPARNADSTKDRDLYQQWGSPSAIKNVILTPMHSTYLSCELRQWKPTSHLFASWFVRCCPIEKRFSAFVLGLLIDIRAPNRLPTLAPISCRLLRYVNEKVTLPPSFPRASRSAVISGWIAQLTDAFQHIFAKERPDNAARKLHFRRAFYFFRKDIAKECGPKMFNSVGMSSIGN